MVAKYIVNRCVKSGTPISNLQLQKILYFVQMAFLKKLDKPCFSDDIEACSLALLFLLFIIISVALAQCLYGPVIRWIQFYIVKL